MRVCLSSSTSEKRDILRKACTDVKVLADYMRTLSRNPLQEPSAEMRLVVIHVPLANLLTSILSSIHVEVNVR